MKYQVGDLLREVKRGVILQQVNAQGVMGSGIAKDIRARWPVVWQEYSRLVPSPTSPYDSEKRMGMVIPVEVEPDLWVFNVVGQQYFGRDGSRYTSYDALDKGLGVAGQLARLKGFLDHDVHHPKLGSGLGGGHWPIVAAIIEHAFGRSTTCWTLE